ncbi:MAG TPA: carboxypeptidase-like regulatory domain-containing protein [Gemmatimonadaceae bacterium]|jgi:hypothetical protein|nr:carboxypeptidase-like regulatory domain-containing protein [Gemmatimonadaceae bacterium]
MGSLFRRLRAPLAISALSVATGALSVGAQSPIFPRVQPTKPGAVGTGTIDGFVSDTALVPIHAAFVSLLGTQIRIGTGPNGRFRITKIPAGQYLVIVKHVGHRPESAVVDVKPNDTLRLSYMLEPAAQELTTVVIAEKAPALRMQEFEQRRRTGVGEFMTEAEIHERNSVFATELFRKFLAIDVSPSRTTANTEYYALSAREGGNPQVGACPMPVYLDQVPLPTPFNLDLLPSPNDLAGIEVYSGAATLPPQFNGFNHGCGVVLVWTKIGIDR